MDGKKVLEIRKKLGLSQADFAKKFGVQVSTVWRWETGRSEPRDEIAAELLASVRETAQDIVVEAAPTTTTFTALTAPSIQPTKPEFKERSVHVECEKALLAAAAQVTAAWIAGHKDYVRAEEVMVFIRKVTRALRED